MLISMIRTVLLYSFVIFAIRALGKRQVGELEAGELTFMILLSDLAAIPMQDTAIPILSGIVPIVLLMTASVAISLVTMRNPRARKLFYGKPSIIIENGRLNQREIQKLRLSLDEISEELRLQGAHDMKTVKFGIVETNGQLSVMLYPGFKPATKGDLNIESPVPSVLSYTIISNGALHRENLPKYGITEGEIDEILQKRNIGSVKDVFYMASDPAGGFTVVRREKI